MLLTPKRVPFHQLEVKFSTYTILYVTCAAITPLAVVV